MALVGASVAMLIGITIFAEVDDAIDCSAINGTMNQACEDTKNSAWTILGIMPIVLFFLIFITMGGFSGIGSKLTPEEFDYRVKKKKDLTITQKILITIGLAKVKRLE